jgi:2-keto-myo-inositol isomerase
MSMKKCINGATTMPYSLQEDIKAAGETGFEGVEIWRSKLDRYLQVHRKDDLLALLSSNKLSVAAICPFSGYVWCAENELKNKMDELEQYFNTCEYIGCELLLVCAETPKDKSRREIIDAHVSRLRKIANIGENYNVGIALEWFSDLRDAIEIVELAAHKYVSLMVDTFHWYRGDGNLNHIDLIPGNKLSLVHINDSEDLRKNLLNDNNRLYCGQGVIPLVEFLKKIKHKSYEEYLSVEIFREEYWKKDSLTISKESLKSLSEIMKIAGL